MDLPEDQRRRLCLAFNEARRLWGPRAAFAREAEVDTSTVQALEGKRTAPVSDDMINRLTVAAGWPPHAWRKVAAGEMEPPRTVRVRGPVTAGQIDQPLDLAEVPTTELLAELARRTSSERPSS